MYTIQGQKINVQSDTFKGCIFFVQKNLKTFREAEGFASTDIKQNDAGFLG